MADSVATASTQTANDKSNMFELEPPALNGTLTPTPLGSPAVQPVNRVKQQHDDSIVQYEDEYEKLNSQYQVAWNKVMGKGPLTSASYESAAVLLLSWDKDYDDLGVKEEVDSLGTLFKETFNYDVHKVCLTSSGGVTPQQQVNLQVATFVASEDRPKKLLIVYYAGHGEPGNSPGHLELSSGVPTQHDVKGKLNKVIWNHAEHLLQDARADVLEIFDCCYAGSLGIRSPSTRSFEYLAATGSNDTTKSPGPHSFTSALIWSLEELVKERGCFTTQQLMHKIYNDAPGFPRDQRPVLSKRNNMNPANYIMLEPISLAKEMPNLARLRTSSSHEAGQPEVLNLKFIFDTRPAISDVQELGKALNDVMEERDFRVRRIMWGGLHSRTRFVMAEAAHKFLLGSSPRHRQFGSGSSPETLLFSVYNQAGRPQGHLSSTQGGEHDGQHEHSAHDDGSHGIAYHWKMLLIGIWVASVSLITFFPEKGRLLYGPRGFVSLAGILAGMLYIFLAVKSGIEEI